MKFASFGVLLLLFLPLLVVIPTASATHNTVTVSTAINITWGCTTAQSATFTGPNNDRFLFLFSMYEVLNAGGNPNKEITGATWNGKPFIRHSRDVLTPTNEALDGRRAFEVWYVIGPPGDTADVTVTLSQPLAGGEAWRGCSLVGFRNVNQATPFVRESLTLSTTTVTCGAGGCNDAVSNTAPTRGITTMVVDFVSFWNGFGGFGAWELGVGQTAWDTFGTQAYQGSTEPGAAITSPPSTTTMSWDWVGDTADQQYQSIYTLFSSGEVGTGGVGGGSGVSGSSSGSGADIGFKADFGIDVFGWLFPPDPASPRNCLGVTLEDTRSVAASAILYLWGWGDGSTTQTVEPRANHQYVKEEVFTVTIRVQYRNGAIEIFTLRVDTREANCAFSGFVQDLFPILLALVVLLLISAVIVQTTKRLRMKPKRRLRRLFLTVALLALGIMAAVAIYTSAMGIPV